MLVTVNEVLAEFEIVIVFVVVRKLSDDDCQ